MKKAIIIFSSCLILLVGGFVAYKYCFSNKTPTESEYADSSNTESTGNNEDEISVTEPIDSEKYLNEIAQTSNKSENVAHTWYLEPTIEAEDIIVSDNQEELNSTTDETSIDTNDENNSLVAEEGIVYKGIRDTNGFMEYFTMTYNKSLNCFYVESTNNDGMVGGFDLPVSGYENSVYTYSNGESYYRNAISGGRVTISSELTGTITVDSDGNLVWLNNSISNVIDEFLINLKKE